MKIGFQGEQLIKQYERCRLTSYLCPAGVWTIGWGHTGKDVKQGMQITQNEADELFHNDIEVFEVAVDAAVEVELNQQQFDALVCLAYNIGVGAFARSTLVSKLNTGDYLGAAMEFQKWSLIKGERSLGLLRRRFESAALFLS